jgi:hypothetical protein
MANPLPLPKLEALVIPRDPKTKQGQKDPQEGFVANPWERWFAAIAEVQSRNPVRLVAPISLTGQSASIVGTTIAPNQTIAGLYRLSYYTRITTVDAVSSSLTITLGWTDHAQALTNAFSAITGNTVSTFQNGRQEVYLDANTPILYATTYVSNTPGQMKYQLYVMIEAVGI